MTKKSNTYNLGTTEPIMTQMLQGIVTTEWAFAGGPTTFFNKSKMADGSHIEFVKC